MHAGLRAMLRVPRTWAWHDRVDRGSRLRGLNHREGEPRNGGLWKFEAFNLSSNVLASRIQE